MTNADPTSELQGILEPVVAEAGLYLEGVQVAGAPPKRTVTVTIDLPDGPGGVGSEALGDVSRKISAALDEADDVLAGAYVLEVTTPGATRPLTEQRHFRRAQGRLVTVQTQDGPVQGRVLGADADGVRLLLGAGKKATEEQTLGWDQVQRGTVEFELRRK